MDAKQLLQKVKKGDKIYILEYNRLKEREIKDIIGENIIIQSGKTVELLPEFDLGWELTPKTAILFRKRMLQEWLQEIEKLEKKYE